MELSSHRGGAMVGDPPSSRTKAPIHDLIVTTRDKEHCKQVGVDFTSACESYTTAHDDMRSRGGRIAPVSNYRRPVQALDPTVPQTLVSALTNVRDPALAPEQPWNHRTTVRLLRGVHRFPTVLPQAPILHLTSMVTSA